MSSLCIDLLLSPSALSENDLVMDFRGTWRHGRGPLSLVVNISTGCDDLVISANGSSLSVSGQIAAHCKRAEVMDLTEVLGFDSAEESNIALYWEPLLDQLKLQVNQKKQTCRIYVQAIAAAQYVSCMCIWLIEMNSGEIHVGGLSFFVIQVRGKTLTLCWPASVQGSCCTDMSHGSNTPEAPFGIINASVQHDLITLKIMRAYIFRGTTINCSKGNGCYVLYMIEVRIVPKPPRVRVSPAPKFGTVQVKAVHRQCVL